MKSRRPTFYEQAAHTPYFETNTAFLCIKHSRKSLFNIGDIKKLDFSQKGHIRCQMVYLYLCIICMWMCSSHMSAIGIIFLNSDLDVLPAKSYNFDRLNLIMQKPIIKLGDKCFPAKFHMI